MGVLSGLNQESEAEATAMAQIEAMFQRPSQLEKLDMLRKRADQKKAAVEAMLRTGIQSQLEGIRSAISHLQSATDDVKEIEKSMDLIFEQLKLMPTLQTSISRLSQANVTHSQYAAAMENLKHLLNVSNTIEKTYEFISDGKLLHAHKNIMELENARDDLMFEVHKLNTDRREFDKNLLKNYFVDVEKLVTELAKQIWYICSRALEMVCGVDSSPHQLVSALRIIEREERIDQYYIDQSNLTNKFMPPNRPRSWRKQLFDVLLKNVQHRVEGSQFEDGMINKQSWLARYLEVCRRVVVEDLKIVKSGLVSCFPPEYRIYDRYIKFYHDSITSKIREIASETLEKNELVQLLSWIQAYPFSGEAILGNPKLNIQANVLVQENPLLPKSTTNQLYDRYIDLTRRDISEWLDKALVREKDDWYNHEQPEIDNNDCYYTQLPSILFGMVNDSVALSKEFSVEIVPKVIDVGIDEFHTFFGKYKGATQAYKLKHFEDRAFFENYTATMITIANNLDICNISTDKLEKHIRLTMESVIGQSAAEEKILSLSRRSISSISFSMINRQELVQKIEQLKRKWNYGMEFAISALLEEIFQDIHKHLEQLMTKNWFVGSADLETICITITDYYDDYKHLRPSLRFILLKEILYKLVAEFIVGIDAKRLSFSNYDERHLAVNRLRVDANRIEKLFKPYFEETQCQMPMITPVLLAIADVLDLRDKTLLSLEISAFVRKYPDVYVDLLASIIVIREDTSRSEARTIAEEGLNHARYHPKGNQEILKLFQLCRAGGEFVGLAGIGRRAIPALESSMQNMFATLVMTTAKTGVGN